MNNPIKQNPKPYRSNVTWSAVAGTILLVVYAYVYYYEPLSRSISPYWNDKLIDVLTLIPAVAAAWLGTLLTRQFMRDEPPQRIWLMFTIGWWWWVAGEISGFVYDAIYPDAYPDFTFIDVCWLMGYFFFGLALYYQFRLIYDTKENGRSSKLYFILICSGLVIAFGLTKLAMAAGLGEGIPWLALYLAVLYPVFDLTEGGAAIWLSFLFGRGVWGRPWWGLIAFAMADSISIFFWIGGDTWLSKQTVIILDLFGNTVYVLGYLLTSIAFLATYNLIRYGPGERKTKSIGNTIQTT